MGVFITGASGFMGRAVARGLVNAGHSVKGLSRSSAADARLRELGAEPCRGDLRDLDALSQLAAASDAIMHAAIDYGDPDFGAVEASALRTLLAGRSKPDGPFVYVSSTLVYGDTGPEAATEQRAPAARLQPSSSPVRS